MDDTLPTLVPFAVQKPLPAGHSAPGFISDKNLIVLHVTGGSTMEGAYQTFLNSKRKPEGKGLTSAHVIIDPKGTIFQLLPLSEIAYHASFVNRRSIGIEHVAIPPGTVYGGKTYNQPATEEQYAASAMLVRWLCDVLGIPCDRANIQGHNEASPKDKHVGCCEPTLSVERIVSMAAALPTSGEVVNADHRA